MQRQSRGFSIIELMVVVTIIVALIAILVPIFGSARTASRRVACRAQLSDLGRVFQMYLNDSKNKLPHVNPIPTLTVLSGMPIPELLAKYTKDVSNGWKCPDDQIRRRIRGTPEGFETYFVREGLSYLYNPTLAVLYAGKQLKDHPLYRQKKQNQLAVFWEFEAFHGPENTLGSMNYLFADMHVGDLANE